ncbi:MAG: cytochrome P460 family protein [Candidatus Scalindua sp.]|nr:cytochrome P460 family protein [Candidatus Scalindua sp.]
MKKGHSHFFVFVVIMAIGSLMGYTSSVSAEFSAIEAAKSEHLESDAIKAGSAAAEAAKSGNLKADAIKAGSSAIEAVKSGNIEADSIKDGSAAIEAAKSGNLKVDAIKDGSSAIEAVKSEHSKTDAIKDGSAAAEAAKSGNLKADAIKAEASGTETAKVEHSRADATKAGSFSAGFPYGYQGWTNTFAKVVQAKGPFYGFQRVLVSLQALDAYTNNSSGYENGDVLVLEFNEIENENDGMVKGEVNWIAVMVKDSSATETGGWRYAAYDGKTKMPKEEVDPVTGCYNCHMAVKNRDYVFSELK